MWLYVGEKKRKNPHMVVMCRNLGEKVKSLLQNLLKKEKKTGCLVIMSSLELLGKQMFGWRMRIFYFVAPL